MERLSVHTEKIMNKIYAIHKFYSFEDFKKQLAVHNRKYNNLPMRPLNWKSPADYIKAFIVNGEVF